MLTCGLALVLFGVTYSWIFSSLFSSQVLIILVNILPPPQQPVGLGTELL